jgi:tetratricopeptide (TPR) repeat protein
MKRYNESLDAYDSAIVLIEESDTEELARTWLSKAVALSKTGKHDEAREALEKSLFLLDKTISANPGEVSLLQSKGWALLELGRYNESLAIYDQILEISPNIEPYLTQTNALIGRGDALHALCRYREALESYNKALETGPNFGNAWHGKGEAQKALGQGYNASMSFYVAQELGFEK